MLLKSEKIASPLLKVEALVAVADSWAAVVDLEVDSKAAVASWAVVVVLAVDSMVVVAASAVVVVALAEALEVLLEEATTLPHLLLLLPRTPSPTLQPPEASRTPSSTFAT